MVTEPFFVNSKGNSNFRVRSIIDQFTSIIEEELAEPMQTLLKRQVAHIMPLVFSTKSTVEKKKFAASKAHNLIDGYTYKVVHKAVGKRQDQQKYLTQHLRAKECIRMFPHDDHVDSWLGTCYSKNKWNESDMQNVYFHTNIITIDKTNLHCNLNPDTVPKS